MVTIKYYLLMLVATFLCVSCSNHTLKEKEGFVEVEGGRIWYKMVGSGEGTPLLLIHGGPGGRSCHDIEGYSSLGKQRPIIFYDQLGSGFSDKPQDTTLWKLPRFVEEVIALRKALDLQEIHLLGHSWGGAVAIEYLLTKQPEGIRSVILEGPLVSTAKWMEDARTLVSQLPPAIRDTIQKYEALQQYEAPAYLAATDSFYIRHLSRKQWPMAEPAPCEGALLMNMQVYKHMWGPTEFTATGTLKNFDRTSRLPELQLPVLFVAGEYDEARPQTMYAFQKQVKGSTVEIIENAGHMLILDQPTAYTKVLDKFLSSVEAQER